ncbi:MAG: ribose-phosphate pyrophosphokinase [Oscillospiraceae bacterium]|nr:ribose-phosphate pyrophosphokinase [Oscillospiraceae bacterium]
MPETIKEFTIPFGNLGIIALPGCKKLAEKIDRYIVDWRRGRSYESDTAKTLSGYRRDSYIIDTEIHRFGTGEGKAVIKESVRGHDLFILCDMFNYSVKTRMYGMDVPMTPDGHFADLKRMIAAVGGRAHRITVIMPMLYEGRQHKRDNRESLDCAMALQELCELLGVDCLITFDAHDARVQNAIPLKSFENVSTAYQMVKALVNNFGDVRFDRDKTMIISPDEGGIHRCIYYSTVLKLELGMFYKQRDYSRIVDGRHPILEHEYLGSDVKGKDVIIVDDMISSGDSMLDVAKKLKELNAGRIYIFSAFGLFCNGLDDFDKAYKNGLFDGIFTTNMIYQTPGLLKREWYYSVEMSKYISLIIDTLNHDKSMSKLLSPTERLQDFLRKNGY